MLGRIETVDDPMAAPSAYDPEDKVVARIHPKGQDAREATASEILAGPDDDGIRLELSVHDADFYDTSDTDENGEMEQVIICKTPAA